METLEWSKVAVEWVNSLELAANPVVTIEEMMDGKFFCEILHLLFGKAVDINNKNEIFAQIQICIQDRYTPKDWINFQKAKQGYGDELLKIVSVIISTASFQVVEKIFQENPSERLTVDSQRVLRNFLITVLQNKKIVDDGCIDCVSNSKENEESISRNVLREQLPSASGHLVPRVLFPKKHRRRKLEKDLPPQSPLIFVASPYASPSRRNPDTPLRDLFMSPHVENEVLRNNISALQANERILRESLQDLEKECNQFRDEKITISKSFEECKKELSDLRAKQIEENLNSGMFHVQETPVRCPSPYKSKITEMKKQLKKSKQSIDILQTDNFELTNSNEELCKTFKISQAKEKELGVFIKELQSELEVITAERDQLKSERSSCNETIASLQSYIQEMKQSYSVSLPDHTCNTSFTSDNDQSFQQMSSSGFGENLGNAVIDIQLKEVKLQLEETEIQLRESNLANKVLQTQMREMGEKHESDLRESEENLKKVCFEFQEEKSRLECITRDLESSVQNKALELDTKQTEVEEFKKKIETSILENELLRIECTEIKRHNADLEEKFSNQMDQTMKMSETVSSLEIKLQGSNLEIHGLQTQMREIGEKYESDLRESEENLKKVCFEFQEEKSRLDRVTRDLETAVQNKVLELDSKQSEVEEFKRKIDTSRQENELLRTECTEIQRHNADLEEKFSNQMDQTMKMSETVSSLEMKLRGSNLEIQALQAQMREMGEKHESDLRESEENLKKVCFEFREEKSRLDRVIRDLETAVQNKVLELDNKQSEVEEFERKIQSTRQQNELLRTESAEIKECNTDLEEKLSNQTDQIAKMSETVSSLEIKLRDSYLNNEDLHTKMKKMEEKHESDMRESKEDMKKVCSEFQEEKSRLDRATRDLESAFQKKVLELDSKHTEIEEFKRKIMTSILENEMLRTECTEIKRHNADLEEKLSNQMDQTAKMSETVRSLEIKLQGSNLEIQGLQTQVKETEGKHESDIREYKENLKKVCFEFQEEKSRLECITRDLESSVQDKALELDTKQTEVEEFKKKILSSRQENEHLRTECTEIKRHNADLEEKVSTQIDKTAKMSDTLRSLEIELQGRNLEIQDLQTQMKETEGKHESDLRESEENLKKVCFEFEEEKSRLESITRDLESSVRNKVLELDSKRTEVEEFKRKIETSILENELLRIECTEIKRHNADLEEKFSNQMDQITKMSETVSSLEISLRGRNLEIQGLQTEMREMGEKHESDLRESEENLRKVCFEFEEEKSRLDRVIRDLEAAVQNKVLELDNKQTEVEEFERKIQSSRQEIELLRTESAEIKKCNTDLDEKLSNQTAKMSETVSSLEIKLQGSNLEVQTLQTQMREMGERYESDLRESEENVKKVCYEFQEEKSRLDRINRDLENAVQNKALELDSKHAEVEEFKRKIETSRQENEHLRTECTEIQRHNAHLEEKLCNQIDKIAKMSDTVRSLEVKLQGSNLEIQGLQTQMKETERKHESDVREYEENLRNVCFGFEQEKSRLESITRDLESSVRNKVLELDSKHTEVEEFKRKIETSILENELLRTECTEIKKNNAELEEKLSNQIDQSATMSETVSSLEIKLRDNNLEIQTLQTQMREMGEKHESDLRESEENLKKVCFEFQEEKSFIGSITRDLENIVQNKLLELDNKQAEVEEFERKIQSTRQQNELLRTESAEIKKCNADLEEKLSNQTDQIAKMSETVSSLEIKLRGSNLEIHGLQTQMRVMGEKYESDLRESEENLKKACSEFREEKSRPDRVIRDLETAVQNKVLELDGKQAEVEEFERKILSSIKENELLHTESAEIKKRNADLEDQTAKMSETVSSLEIKLRGSYLNNEDLQTKMKEMEEKHESDLRESKEDMKKVCSEFQEEKSRLDRINRDLENAVQNKVLELDSKQTEVEEFKRKIETSRQENEFLLTECTEIKRHNADLEEKLSNQTDRTAKISETVSSLEIKLRCSNLEIQALQTQMNQIEEKHESDLLESKENLKKTYSERFEQTKSHMKLMTKDLERDLENKKVELKNKNTQIATLLEQIENLKREKGQIRAECIELHNKVYQQDQKLLQAEKKLITQGRGLSSSRLHSTNLNSQNSGGSTSASFLNTGMETLHLNSSVSVSTNSLNLISDRRLSNCSKASVSSNGSGSGRPKVVPSGSGSLFMCEDEDFNFSEKNKNDMKHGSLQTCCSTRLDDQKCAMCKLQRKAELSRRNTMVAPHLRDCYVSELNLSDGSIRVPPPEAEQLRHFRI